MQGHNHNISQLGEYRLIRLLGEGGFAKVYLGEHIHLRTNAAIKVLNEQHLSSVDQQGFLMEAQTIANLQHDHIVRVLGFNIEVSKSGHDSSIPYLVMEYLSGGTLRQHHPHGTIVPLPQIASYVSQVADALQYAHKQGIVHLDVKPENMLLEFSDTSNIKLGDFGIAVTGHDSKKRLVIEDGAMIQGTIPYVAPERFTGSPHRSSDQYSLGIVVYEWLTGIRPFEGTQQQIIFKHINTPPPPLYGKYLHITKEIETVVLRALEKAPGQRYPSVKEFAEALKNALMTAPPLDVQPPTQASSADADAEKPPSAPPKIPVPPKDPPKQQPAPPRQPESPYSPKDRPDPSAPTVPIKPPQTTPSNQPAGGFIAEFIEIVQDQLQVLWKWIELDSEFARLPQNRFFRNCGMLLNFLSAFLVGLLPPYGPSGWLIFYSLLFSIGLFTLCIRTVQPPLSKFFGLSVALYWGFVGLVIGVGLQYTSLPKSLFPPPLLAIVFFGISAYLHLRYVKTRLP